MVANPWPYHENIFEDITAQYALKITLKNKLKKHSNGLCRDFFNTLSPAYAMFYTGSKFNSVIPSHANMAS